jgi:integration host factor subunit alpha
MAGKTATRAELTEAVYQMSGLSRHEAAGLVEQVLTEISDALTAGQNVKLSGFGVFTVRDKAERVGRNPKTGIEVPIEPRRSVTFKASETLKEHVNGKAVSSSRT